MTAKRTLVWPSVGRNVIFVVAVLVFFVPLISAAVFGFTLPGKGFTLSSLTSALAGSDFLPGLLTSFMLMFTSTALLLGILVPTLVSLHVRAPGLLVVAEALSLLPFVVPAIALVNGVSLTFGPIAPGFLASVYSLIPFYAVLVMPLAYRALDAGIRTLNVGTLYDAASSLGAPSWRIMFGIILPNMWPAIMVASLLSFVMTLGEFVLASLLLHDTFPVFVVVVGQRFPRAAAALSFLVIIGTWLLMALLSAIASRRNLPTDELV